jgi:putative endopeptidase
LVRTDTITATHKLAKLCSKKNVNFSLKKVYFRNSKLEENILERLKDKTNACGPRESKRCRCQKVLFLMTTANVPIDVKNMDFSVSPRQSFYFYSNGGWLAKNQIPADKTAWGAFDELRDKSRDDVRSIYDLHAKMEVGESLIGELYLSAMNSDLIEEARLKPIEDLLLAVDNLKDKKGFARLNGMLVKEDGQCSFFLIEVLADFKQSDINTLGVFQDGLGLPSKEFYFDEAKKEYVEKYRMHIKNIFVLAGEDEDTALGKADSIIALETKLADFSLAPVQMRDITAIYNPVSLKEFEEMAPSLYLTEYLKSSNLSNFSFFIHSKKYFTELNALIEASSMQLLRDYMKFKIIHSYSPFLGIAFEREHFDFVLKGLKGQPEMEERWQRTTDKISLLLEHEIGKEYIANFFSNDAKDRCQQMVQYILDEYGVRIKSLAWMSEETKEKALKKLSTFRVKIGYPSEWKSYTLLHGLISRSKPYCTNIRYAKAYHADSHFSKAGKPVDKEEWGMPPFMVNAYYSPFQNEIVFPAAILQPPFFYAPTKGASYGFPALNFGGIGAVIAHEISHGFDDQGCLFDHNGNMENWWTESDKEEFSKRCGKIVAQFNKYSICGHTVNGELCQGENIADLGGVSISFAAFKKFASDHPEAPVPHTKFSQEQQFFISYATIWRRNMRKDTQIQYLAIDPHSPAQFRCDGPLSNFSPYHDSFGVHALDRMFTPEEERVEIW